MSWITENIISFLTDCISGTLDMFGTFIDNIFFMIVDLATSNVYIRNAEKFLIIVSLALISVGVIKVVLSGYMMETDYDSEADPFNLLVKVAETVAFMTSGNWIFYYLLASAKDFTQDLVGGSNASSYVETTKVLLHAGNLGVAYIVMLIVILGAMIAFTIVAGMRGVELVGMMLFFPLFCLDLLTNSRERWKNFSMAYMTAFFTYSFQVLFFVVALKCYVTTQASGGIAAPDVFAIYAIGTLIFLIMAIRTPKFLEKYLYTSGLSNAASSGVRMMIQTAVMRGTMR